MIANGVILLVGIGVGMIVYYCGYETGYSNGHRAGTKHARFMMATNETKIQQ